MPGRLVGKALRDTFAAVAARDSVVASSLVALDGGVATLRSHAAAWTAPIDRWRADAAAVLFHLNPSSRPPVVVILGGTGTGKSTILNRVLGATLSAASFRRTFTAGAVAAAARADQVPTAWLGLPAIVVPADQLPARGSAQSLSVAIFEHPLSSAVTLVDTPDVDGDQPAHIEQADLAFRWAQAVLFVVSPEKYQMTELLPYYRLCRRWSVPTLFVMNKCQTTDMLDDYRRLLQREFDAMTPPLFAIARDDATFTVPPEFGLDALRNALQNLPATSASDRAVGQRRRARDLLGRLGDMVIAPMRADRADVDRLAMSVAALQTPPSGVDVNPITRQLQRRLQQRSVLYLMGPGRVLDRIRQMPVLLTRLPRNAWDIVIRGKSASTGEDATAASAARGQLPDFRATLIDQFIVLQSRIDDILRSSPAGSRWLGVDAAGFSSATLDRNRAGQIADQELDELKQWLSHRWNATPRDTAMLYRLLKLLPGGEKLAAWSEAAPYLLALVVAAHHAIFGPVDLMVVGGFSLATWLTEKLSNEVASRARATNRRIEDRFSRLARDQIAAAILWIQKQAPPRFDLDKLQSAAESLAAQCGADE